MTLFDCGPGTLRQLADVGLTLGAVERVVLSHYHLDHCLDLFALAFARRNLGLDPVPPLEVIGPTGLMRLAARGEASLGRWARDPRVSFHEVDPRAPPGSVLERAGLRLSWTATGHTEEAVAWRVDLPEDLSVAYSGDSPEEPAVAALARKATLFVCECSHADEDAVEGHLTPSSAARLALASGCERLLLTHFYPALDPRAAAAAAARIHPGAIELARDGLVLEL